MGQTQSIVVYKKKSKRESSPSKELVLSSVHTSNPQASMQGAFTPLNEQKFIEVLLERRVSMPKRPAEFKIDFSIYSQSKFSRVPGGKP